MATGEWPEDRVPDDELELAEELADLHADPVFADADQAEMNELDDATAAMYATADDED